MFSTDCLFYKLRLNLWDIPEIRNELIGNDEPSKKLYFKKSFDTLIQRLARPAVNSFIENPRSKCVRVRVMEEYQMELVTLDKFVINGQITERGLFQFLANGKHGEFAVKLMQADVHREISQLNLNLGLERFHTTIRDSYAPFKVADSQFNKLTFSQPPERLSLVLKEINEDVSEFLECMTNSVFYWSGILRFCDCELEKLKRHFIELQTEKQVWSYYFEKYVLSEDMSIRIPRSKITSKQYEQQRIIKCIKAIKSII